MSMMVRRALTVLLAASALMAVTLTASPSALAMFPGYTYYARPGDFVEQATYGDATESLQPDGWHLHTSGPGAFLDAHFAPPGGPVPLGDFNQYGYQVDYIWTGSAAEPAIHYDIDLDGDGRADMELVGEHKYGGDDLWLNRDFHVAHRTVSNQAIESAAPCVGKRVRQAVRQGCSPTDGYGGRFHGGILDWSSGLYDAGLHGVVVQAGFVAYGSDVDGVLSEIGLGIYHYRMTSTPNSPTTVTLKAHPKRVAPGDSITITAAVESRAGYPKVDLQQRTPGGAWTTIDTQTLYYGPSSYYHSVTAPSTPGTVQFRMIAEDTNANLESVSKTVRVRVVG